MGNLILIGGGGHCKSVIDVAEGVGYNILGILDVPSEVGKSVLGYPIVGIDADIDKYVNQAEFLITVGQIKSPDLRMKLHEMVINAGGKLATVIASTAHVSKHAVLEEGTVVMNNAFVNADAKVGKGCIINSFADIEHDAVIGNYCHISTGVMINGGVNVHDGCFIGSQSVVNQCVSISERSIIASGSLVNVDIHESGVYYGNPTQIRKFKRE